MARQYIRSSNPFEDGDDIDDETFLRNSRPKNAPSYAPATSYSGHTLSDLEAQRQTMIQRQREIEQRTLDSSARSVGLLRDSEQIGVATAEELVKQREQLENTSQRLDEINTNLRISQRHLNGIKSVFGSLKNYLSGKNQETPRSTAVNSPGSRPPTVLDQSIETPVSIKQASRSDLFESHPSTRLRGLSSDDTQTQHQVGDGPSSESRRVNELLDANLDEMVSAISRLKRLGTDLGQEIEDQNRLIDTIHDKTDLADININKQNKQMNKLLGK